MFCCICAKSFVQARRDQALCRDCHEAFPDVQESYFCKRCGIYMNRPLYHHRCTFCTECGSATIKNRRFCGDCFFKKLKAEKAAQDYASDTSSDASYTPSKKAVK